MARTVLFLLIVALCAILSCVDGLAVLPAVPCSAVLVAYYREELLLDGVITDSTSDREIQHILAKLGYRC
ncbi:hypothetical protein HW555_010769 [Spodoptera exigua]|uniref:Uncharacterized protein n=1 Tax=Spodoptera exigua TaxID=7107 RepID=A0A835G6N4_SPOEX|nr:hypothetical protein HW555_010769 [Spodoptera exigua]